MRGISTGKSTRWLANQIQHALRNVDGLITYAFEVGIDLNHRQDEAQVDGHRLLHGEQVERQFVDLALGVIDGGLAGQHHVAELWHRECDRLR